tara:strand:- start:54 stop:563 length:510 start_codon:yes stop_codon:yes gene_type:complete
MPNTFTRAPKTAWTHRRRFYVTAADDDKRYFESPTDVSDSMAKWDVYDDSPTAILAGNIFASYIAPIKCYLTSYEAIAQSFTADDRPYQIEIYYGTPTLDTGGTQTLALAAVSNGATSHDERREPERLYEDWGQTIVLDQGDVVLPTIKSNYDGSNVVNGTITIFFREF